MPKVGPATLAEIESALTEYAREVRGSRLRPSTQKTYLIHAEHFVRWLNNDFEPGGQLK